MASTDESQQKQKRTVVIAMDDSEHARFALNWYKENMYRSDDEVYVVYSVELSQKLQGEQLFETEINKEIVAILQDEKQKYQARLEALTDTLQKTGVSVINNTQIE
ncbi:hypothetical protein KUTeg_020746 [Tegillarca granosa]|uniref:UspA domain-containing protein n=1 Tax=Tegillarca granosa TaxID=220873 RepID=A0ABQ9E8U3_TEGGR|nr:hypothetical protein KUTeg_020746 [Tegillarca granosa]